MLAGDTQPAGDDADSAPSPGEAGDGNPDADGGAQCDPNAPFGAPSLLVPQPGGLLKAGAMRLSPDYLTAYLGGQLPQDSGGMYMTTRPTLDAPFSLAVRIPGAGLASPDEREPTVTGSGLLLAFSKGSFLIERLRFAVRAGPSAPFVDVGSMPLLNASVGTDHWPFFREDGQVLYFASTRDVSKQDDIYRSARSGPSYDTPSVIDEINSSSDDNAPAVTPDDRVIYFASNRVGPGAQGNLDIYVATRASPDRPFSPPRAVTELNSPGIDVPTFVTRDYCRLYFFSDPSGLGSVATYVATKVAE
jgi:hypothetical protein